MNEILPTILKDTFTLIQLRHRLKVLKSHLLKALFGGKDQYLISREDLNWLATLPQTFFKNFTKDNVYKILDDIQKRCDQLPALTIYLPIEAGDNICLQIGSYARQSFANSQILLDTKFDQSLIAGCALVWRGMYRDYSLRAKIESKKEEILGSFKKFLK